MAQLTWRDVAAPDFSSAPRNFTDAARLLSDSIGRGTNAIVDFDKAQTDLAAQRLATYVAQNPNVQDLAAGFKEGSLGGMDLTSRRYQAAALDQLNPTKLNAMLGAQQAQVESQRAFDQRQALNDATPVLSQIIQAHIDNRPDEAKRLSATVNWGKLGYKTAEDFLTKGPGLDRAAFQDANTRQDDTISTLAQDIVARAAASSGTPEEAAYLTQEYLAKYADNPNYGRISSQVNSLLGSGSNAGGGMSPTGGASTGAGLGSVSGDALAMTFGGAPLDGRIQTVGDLISNKSSLLAQKGATPVGVYQINAGTWQEFGQKALGKDWASKPIRDFATQDAVGKAIFESTGGDYRKLMGRWASLSEAEAKSIAGKPWEQARQVIAKGETGADIGVVQGKAIASQGASVTEAGNQDPTGLASRMLAAAGQRSDLTTIAKQVATQFGMTEANANQTLRMIMDRGLRLKSNDYPDGIRITPAQAVEVFKEARRNEGVGGFLLGWMDQDNAAGKGMRVDDRVIDETIKTYASPQAIQQSVIDADRARLQQSNAAALAAFQAADANYKRALNDAANNPRYNPVLLARAKAARDRAAAVAQVSQAALSDRTNPQYTGDRSLTVSGSKVGNDYNARKAPKPKSRDVASILKEMADNPPIGF